MQIDVISDTICPWCYIGKRRLEAALAQRPDIDFNVTYRPFQLNPNLPKGGMDRLDHLDLKFGGRDAGKKVFDVIAATGREDGIDFDFSRQEKVPNTFDSHRLNHWAETAGVQDEVVEILFRKYFIDGENVGDPAVLLDAAKEAGMDGEVVERLLAGDADKELVEREEMIGRRMGVTGVPCYIIDQKYTLVGAQEPDMLLRAIDTAAAEAADASAQATPPAE